MKKCLAGTLTRMEGHWGKLLQEARNREDTVVFSELESLVQMARFATEKVPPYRETNRISKDSLDMVTPNEPGDSNNSTPEDDGDENAVFHTQGVVATINFGELAKNNNNWPQGNPKA